MIIKVILKEGWPEIVMMLWADGKRKRKEPKRILKMFSCLKNI
jgi:hypothetical protein